MDRRGVLIAETKRIFPDLMELKQQLEEDEIQSTFNAACKCSYSELPVFGGQMQVLNKQMKDLKIELNSNFGQNETCDVFWTETKRALLESGKKAICSIQAEGNNAKLTPAQEKGLEAIIVTIGRPALLIQDGHFDKPKDPWADLEQHRSKIERIFPSVGRIEVSQHPTMDYAGTGFMVSDDIVMTNEHVANVFSRKGSGQWTFRYNSSIDFKEELGCPDSADFALTEVVGIHDVLDLALIRVSSISSKPPKPLNIASKKPETTTDRKVFVVGYPARDLRNDPNSMKGIFWNIYDVKRLQPGLMRKYLMADSGKQFTHDCSTLGGNSGSCVVDLESCEVVGLHYWGKYLEENRAFALWDYISDPLLIKARVNFI